MTTHKIQLDFFFDDVVSNEIVWDDKTVREHGFDLDAKIINECGPGAGCPIVDFIGTEEEIKRFLAEVYCLCGDDVDVEMLEEHCSYIEVL